MANHPNRSISAIQREALRRLSRRADWSLAYQFDVAGSTLALLLDRGMVEAKAGKPATRWRLSDAGRATLAQSST